jgi:hypothetical protein
VLATEWINNVKAAVSKVWMAFPAFWWIINDNWLLPYSRTNSCVV